MIAPKSENPAWLRITLALALFALGVAVSGCADMSENMTTAFADPAKYELYNCKQLEAERKNLGVRAAELQGLISKAETATGGTVVAELAYRNDYIAIRGQSHFAEEAWRKNHCHPSPEAPPGASDNPSAPTAHAKSSQASKAGSTVY